MTASVPPAAPGRWACPLREVAWLAGDHEAAQAEAVAGLRAATQHTDPWLVGPLRRWAHLTGGEPGDASTSDAVTPYRLEVHGTGRAPRPNG